MKQLLTSVVREICTLRSVGMIRTYSMGAVALLEYAHRTLRELRMLYTAHLEPVLIRGRVLPVPEQRDRYVVRENP